MTFRLSRSIRFRIAALAALLTAGLLVGVSVAMVAVFRWQLTENLDETLNERTDAIAAVVGRPITAELGGDEDLLVQLVGSDGVVSSASSNVAGLGLIAPLEWGIRTVNDVPGRPDSFRVITRPVLVPEGRALLLVGMNADDIHDPVRIMTKLLGLSVPGVVLAVGLLNWWLTGRMLRPVERMRSQMADISGSNLGGRIRESETGDEIDRLARTMNQTLDRLEDAVRRQQRFVADASHELRGPLTRIRGELEVDLARPELADPLATERSVLDEAIGLQILIDDLLVLARSDAHTETPKLVPVDLDDIVLSEARRLKDRGRVNVATSDVGAAQVMGDVSQLRRAVRNLFDNAERHATHTVTIALVDVDGRGRLTVGDDGAGIAPGDRQRIFERFARLDAARTRDEGGSGLGLAIARAIVEQHGGSISLADAVETWFVIDLPSIN